MPKLKGRTTNRGSWTQNNLIQALKYVTEEHHSITDSAEKFAKNNSAHMSYGYSKWFGVTNKQSPKLVDFKATFNRKH